MRVPFFSLAVAAIAVSAQSTSSYVDSNTNITFQSFTDALTGFTFRFATANSNTTTDFIGQMIMETNGTGYCGVTLNPEMTGALMVVAWPNDGAVVSSFRETSGYTSPGVYTNSSMSLKPIASGTFVNSTHMSYTFLCSGCLGTGYSFASSSANVVVGWALASTSPTNPSSADSATFVFHSAGYGGFGLAVSNAKSTSFAAWTSLATASTSINTTTSTVPTTHVNATISNSTYDYIIAGAGPAGIIVAQRLSESNKTVLLIERGAASTYATGGRSTVSWNDTVTQYDVPAMSYYLTTASDTSEYCTDVASMAGCILGGGTMVNALMFVRPQEADFNDKWPTGWKWADVSDAALRLYERNPGTTLASSDGKRYDQGAYSVLSAFFGSIGWSQVDAIQSPNNKTEVYSYPPWDIEDGLRAGPVKSYLPLAKAASNFKLTLNTKVIRAVRSGSTVSGVEVEDSTGARQIINVKSGGSVILAAGTMSSPRILINSGIGPIAQINTVLNGTADVTLPAQADWINLPVGKNLKDHPIFTLTFNTTAANATSLTASAFTSPNSTEVDLFAHASGPLAQSGQRLNFWTSLVMNGTTRYFQGTCNSPSAGTIRIKLYLTHGATSSGVLGITSAGATEFTTNPWMNTAEDEAAVTTMIDSLLASVKTSSLLSLSDSTVTGSSLVSAGSYITGDHFVGTAMIGETNDGSAVVDTDTKVFGTDNLFVVDASIHPDLPTGNTQAIIMVAAEQAAAKILALGSRSGKSGSTSSSSASGSSIVYSRILSSSGTASTQKAVAPSTLSSLPLSALTSLQQDSATSTFAPSRITAAQNVTSHAISSGRASSPFPFGASGTPPNHADGQTFNASSTTVTVLSTQVYTMTTSPATGTPSEVIVTETIALTTTVCPLTEASSAGSAAYASYTAKLAAGSPTGIASGGLSLGAAYTTVTIYTTQVSTLTITAPAGSPSTITKTDVIELTTTVCPVTEAASASSAAYASYTSKFSTGIPTSSVSGEQLSGVDYTTVTVYTSEIRTLTTSASAGPPSTFTTTDIIELTTTVCPVTEAASASRAAYASYTFTATSLSDSAAKVSASSSAAGVFSNSTQTTITVLTTQTRSLTTTTTALGKASEVIVTVTETFALTTTVCPKTEAESASSAAYASYTLTAGTSLESAQKISATSSADGVTKNPTQTTITVLTTQTRALTTTTIAAGTTSEVVVTITETLALTTTVCPKTEAASASSAAYASYVASLTGSGIGGSVVTLTSTSSSSTSTGGSSLGSAGNGTVSSAVKAPTGTTLNDLISWLASFFQNHGGESYTGDTVI